MRTSRFTLLVASTLLALALAPALASASVSRVSRGSGGEQALTISVSQNPIVEGQPIVIYGRLAGASTPQARVTLYHRGPFSSTFTPVQSTSTDAAGYYAFERLPEKVLTDREWYVRAFGVRSRTVREHVYAQVTLESSLPSGSTVETGPNHPVTFSGTITPASAGQEIVLQRQEASGGEDWHTIQIGRVGPGGAYSLVHEFRFPGDADIRVLLRRDGLNIASPSSELSYEIEQAENPALTIDAAQNPLVTGQSETISGTLAAGAGVDLTLYQRAGGAHTGWQPVQSTMSGAAGSYTFAAQTLEHSVFYEVRASASGSSTTGSGTTGSGTTDSAPLFVGVKFAVSASPSATTVMQGQPVTLTGSVAPASPEHVVDLQQQITGRWVTIGRSVVDGDSTFTLTQPLFNAGTVTLRAFVPGGPSNQGAGSTPVAITVTPVAASQLPQNTSSANPAEGVAG